MQFGRNPIKNDLQNGYQLHVRIQRGGILRILIGGGHFVSHLGYQMSHKTRIQLKREVDGSNPYMKFGRNPIKNE